MSCSDASVIWVAGTTLSNYTDIRSDRLHLGQALADCPLGRIHSIAVPAMYVISVADLVVLPK